MAENDCTASEPIPLLKPSEEQVGKIRRQLEGIFRELDLIDSVMMLCGAASKNVNSDFDEEVEHVLRRCGSDRMNSVKRSLTEIVERFGGTTAMSETLAEERAEKEARRANQKA